MLLPRGTLRHHADRKCGARGLFLGHYGNAPEIFLPLGALRHRAGRAAVRRSAQLPSGRGFLGLAGGAS